MCKMCVVVNTNRHMIGDTSNTYALFNSGFFFCQTNMRVEMFGSEMKLATLAVNAWRMQLMMIMSMLLLFSSYS